MTQNNAPSERKSNRNGNRGNGRIPDYLQTSDQGRQFAHALDGLPPAHWLRAVTKESIGWFPTREARRRFLKFVAMSEADEEAWWKDFQNPQPRKNRKQRREGLSRKR